MARIRIYSHAASDTVNRLKDALVAAGHNAKKLRSVGGTYRGREGDIVLNYGSSQLAAATIGQAFCLNSPQDITRASNKRESFVRMSQAGVSTVEYTTQRQIAEGWVREGALVYARTRLQGHSGEGIQLVHNNPVAVGDAGGFPISAEVPTAPLYTKGVLGNRREYRVHVFRGKIIHIAQKRRRDGFTDIPEHSNLVRNHHTGWVYSTQNMTELNAAGKRNALRAMEAVDLDFGAVDIITNRDDAWVLEINTAPGMEGVTLEKYVRAISEYANGDEVTGETVDLSVAPQPVQEPTPSEPQPRRTTAREPSPMQRNEQRVASSAPSEQRVATQPGGELEAMQNHQAAARAVPPAPTARGQAASTSRSTASRSPSLENGGYYWLTVNGEQTIGKFNASVSSFEIIGWEVPVEEADVTVGARITA